MPWNWPCQILIKLVSTMLPKHNTVNFVHISDVLQMHYKVKRVKHLLQCPHKNRIHPCRMLFFFSVMPMIKVLSCWIPWQWHFAAWCTKYFMIVLGFVIDFRWKENLTIKNSQPLWLLLVNSLQLAKSIYEHTKDTLHLTYMDYPSAHS